MEIPTLSAQIETPRLILRWPQPKRDARKTFWAIRHEHERLGKYLGAIKQVDTLEKEIARLKDGPKLQQPKFSWLIFEKEGGALVGEIMAEFFYRNDCALSWWLAKNAEGRGYMTEAVRTLSDNLLRKGVEKQRAQCHKSNARSLGTLRRLGFVAQKTIARTAEEGFLYFLRQPTVAKP